MNKKYKFMQYIIDYCRKYRYGISIPNVTEFGHFIDQNLDIEFWTSNPSEYMEFKIVKDKKPIYRISKLGIGWDLFSEERSHTHHTNIRSVIAAISGL